jgi:hypothetical protein
MICIKSCNSVTNNMEKYSISVGFICFTASDLVNASRWISIYSTNISSKDYYLGAYEKSNFCKLDEWRESRMSIILD